MGALTRRRPTWGAVLATLVLGTGAIAAQGLAEPAPTLRAQAAAVARAEAAAALQLYAAESSLARAHDTLAALEGRSASLARAERDARRRAEVVRRSLQSSQERVAALLRDLYVEGEPDPIAVILSATSLDEAVAAIDGLERATALNLRLGVEATQRAGQLESLRARLADRRAALDDARAAATVGTERLSAAVQSKRATLTQLRARATLTSQRIAQLEARAREAQRRSEELAAAAASSAAPPAQSTPAPTTPPTEPAAPAPPGGTRTLVVDAVAYHLPGRTASGLPVGIGVIAVDPTVIPLGTRVLIPGYGPAVAADVGPGVKGNMIDVWLPSTAQARSWGRQTITITIYG